MQDCQIDLLLCLNVLRKHNCCIDLTKNVLRWGDGTKPVFLSVSEYLAGSGQDSDVAVKKRRKRRTRALNPWSSDMLPWL
ncbi:hypothetical protein L596_014838 [Steinernema carpocapsae]|uniref:Uncharacterized protein n=1 Tax=Steinernema carpocapsae TaxID=34508 RepID=A0A4U5NEA2_STECR|nr:hypothetical protein L596_014838 [Steinernema carpocapsae]